jgi:hypothetical protein
MHAQVEIKTIMIKTQRDLFDFFWFMGLHIGSILGFIYFVTSSNNNKK